MTIKDLEEFILTVDKDASIILLNYDGTPVKITPVTTYILEIKK